MGHARDTTYVDPASKPELEGDHLLAEWRALPVRARIIYTLYLLIGGLGGLGGGWALTSAYSNWLTWSISIMILEPVGLTSLAALIYFYWPNSRVGRVFHAALGRAKASLVIILVLVFGGFLLAAGYIVSEFWKLR